MVIKDAKLPDKISIIQMHYYLSYLLKIFTLMSSFFSSSGADPDRDVRDTVIVGGGIGKAFILSIILFHSRKN